MVNVNTDTCKGWSILVGPLKGKGWGGGANYVYLYIYIVYVILSILLGLLHSPDQILPYTNLITPFWRATEIYSWCNPQII